jgi:hypothetical protein
MDNLAGIDCGSTSGENVMLCRTKMPIKTPYSDDVGPNAAESFQVSSIYTPFANLNQLVRGITY